VSKVGEITSFIPDPSLRIRRIDSSIPERVYHIKPESGSVRCIFCELGIPVRIVNDKVQTS